MGRETITYKAPEAEVLSVELDHNVASYVPGTTETYNKEDVDPEFE